MSRSLLAVLLLAGAGLATTSANHVLSRNVTDTCSQISQAISNASSVFFPPDAAYINDIEHYANSSATNSTCSVEPGSAQDIATILGIVGKMRTPFGVKGGGHAMNPNFSSTIGVQIAMTRFNGVDLDADAGTVTVGAGLIWDDVYAALAPHDVIVIGGRVSGVGVAGFSLGGGFSWKTNQFGLTIDNTVEYELVMPNGTIASITATSSPDLFWGLKGGYNNFGVVTKFVFKTYPQGAVWGGALTVNGTFFDDVSNATFNFQQNIKDPKAQIIPAYNFFAGVGDISSNLLFYDGPTPPNGTFDDFLAIPTLQTDIKTRSFLDLVQSAPSNSTIGLRGLYETVSFLEYTPKLLTAAVNETNFWGQRLTSNLSGILISYAIEPFLPSIFSHAPSNSSAYPPERAQGLLPLNIYFAWTDPADDELMRDAARQSAAHLTSVAIEEGQYVGNAALYPNYALVGTPLEKMYGQNIGNLKVLKRRIDPEDVMGLAGGWKF